MITVRRQRVKDARDLGRDDRQWANDERVRRKDWRNLAEVIRAFGVSQVIVPKNNGTQQKSRSTHPRAVRVDKCRCSSLFMHRPPSCEMTLKRFKSLAADFVSVFTCEDTETVIRAE